MDFAQFETDPGLENNGTWFPTGGGSELLVARGGNRAYTKLISSEYDKYRLVLQGDDQAASDKDEEIICHVMAETILLGWRTKQADGSYVETITFKKKSLAYDKKNARTLLKMRDFRMMVARLSDDADAYKVKEEAEQGEV